MPPEPQPSHLDLHHEIQAIGLKVEVILKNQDAIREVVGSAGRDDHGAIIGTGLAGSIARLEERVNARFSRDDGWRRYASGAVAAGAIFLVVLWWIVKDRLHEFFA